jgi:hypothetical protein
VDRKAPPGRVPLAEPPRRGRGIAIAVLVVAAIAVAAWLALWGSGEAPPPERAASPGPSAAPAREPTPSEVADPDEALRLAVHQERRARFEAMRAAFEADARATPASRARLDPALRALWPARPASYGLACRELLCRVELPSPPQASRAALSADPGVRALAEGVFVDPDGLDPAGYVLLAPANALPGDDLLAGVEQELLRSRDARECLSRAGAVGYVEYELRVDVSGFTHRSRSDLPREVEECVDRALGAVLVTTAIPPDVKGASRTFTLRR